jgi:hypothetical protein
MRSFKVNHANDVEVSVKYIDASLLKGGNKCEKF